MTQPSAVPLPVIHAGATVGFNRETPQEVYDGCFKENAHVIESVKKSGSVSRFVFTSSFAAVGHPRNGLRVHRERLVWRQRRGLQGRWSVEQIPLNRHRLRDGQGKYRKADLRRSRHRR